MGGVIMSGSAADMYEIGSEVISGNSEYFYPEECVRSGMPGFKGVGEKLAQALKGLPVSASNSLVSFHKAPEAVEDAIPSWLQGPWETALSWWTIYQILMHPSETSLKVLPTGTQLGCMAEFSLENRTIRVQIDWENGHSIGFRPRDPDWAWNPGTVFAVHIH